MKTFKRVNNLPKMKAKANHKCRQSQCKKVERYMDMNDILSNIY